jgi:hypothetical protein
MPTKSRRENIFIERFLSAYEDSSWADAQIEWLDEKIDGAVEALATRKCDGKILAIEHTIIQPFVGEKEDFAFFEAAFLKIQQDTTLPVPQRWIRMFIPVGILRGQHQRLPEMRPSNRFTVGSRRIGFCSLMGVRSTQYRLIFRGREPSKLRLT